MVNPIIYAGIGAGIGIAIFGILLAMDASSAQQLQFMLIEYEDFRLFDLSMDNTFAVCNPTDFPTSFEKIEATFFYRSTELGTFTAHGDTFQPHIAKDVYGRFNINGQSVFQLFLGALASSFVGQDVDIDQSDFSGNLKIEKKLLGIIPVTTEMPYISSGASNNLVSWEDYEKWGCGYSPKLAQLLEEQGWNTEAYSFQVNMARAKVNQMFGQLYNP